MTRTHCKLTRVNLRRKNPSPLEQDDRHGKVNQQFLILRISFFEKIGNEKDSMMTTNMRNQNLKLRNV